MKAVAITEYGGTDRLQRMELPQPTARAGEVLIRIHAAGVNPVDTKIRQGLLKNRMPNEFPIVPGWDAAGVVEAVGDGVRRYRPGDEVFAYCRTDRIHHGTYAEFIAVPENNVALKPRNLTFVEAASIPLAALTAWQSLFDAASLQRGDRVLVHAAAGGVGGFAVQLAHDRGADVWATASAANHEYVRSLGAKEIVDYTRVDFRRAVLGMDVVFDTVGGDVQTGSADCLRPGGTLVSILAFADEASLKARGVITKYVFVAPNAQQLAALARMCEEGRLRTHIAATFPLEQAAKAHERIESRHTRGKIVLTIA